MNFIGGALVTFVLLNLMSLSIGSPSRNNREPKHIARGKTAQHNQQAMKRKEQEANRLRQQTQLPQQQQQYQQQSHYQPQHQQYQKQSQYQSQHQQYQQQPQFQPQLQQQPQFQPQLQQQAQHHKSKHHHQPQHQTQSGAGYQNNNNVNLRNMVPMNSMNMVGIGGNGIADTNGNILGNGIADMNGNIFGGHGIDPNNNMVGMSFGGQGRIDQFGNMVGMSFGGQGRIDQFGNMVGIGGQGIVNKGMGMDNMNRPGTSVLEQINWERVQEHFKNLLKAFNMNARDLGIKIIQKIPPNSRPALSNFLADIQAVLLNDLKNRRVDVKQGTNGHKDEKKVHINNQGLPANEINNNVHEQVDRKYRAGKNVQQEDVVSEEVDEEEQGDVDDNYEEEEEEEEGEEYEDEAEEIEADPVEEEEANSPEISGGDGSDLEELLGKPNKPAANTNKLSASKGMKKGGRRDG